MKPDRFGVIDFFGILVPGFYLAGVIALCVASALKLLGHDVHSLFISYTKDNGALVASGVLLFAYLLGVVLRLLPPSNVDALSSWFTRHVSLIEEDWVADKFPYMQTISARLEKDGMKAVSETMKWINPHYGAPENTRFLAYCKLFISLHNETLYRHVQEIEALVRFLSGTTLALFVAMPFSAVFAIWFGIRGYRLPAALHFTLFIVVVFCLCVVLDRFKHQRRREIIMVWSCVHLIIKGRCGGPIPADTKLGDVFFFPGADIPVVEPERESLIRRWHRRLKAVRFWPLGHTASTMGKATLEPAQGTSTSDKPPA
jgi:hypothetical protein